MTRFERFSPYAYAALRIVCGSLLAFHGSQKLFGVLTDHQPLLGSQLWVGGLFEFFCGSAVAVGLKTPWAALLLSGQMAVAYFQFHWRFAFDARFFPAINHGELAAVYSFVFLLIACQGPGLVSADGRIAKRRHRRHPTPPPDDVDRVEAARHLENV